jgi:sugar/nucleoside kinase (ribokinase family)
VRDTSGAGDVFHGAYVYSYLSAPHRRWEEHFKFARRAAAFKIQKLGNEAGLPTLDDIAAVAREFEPPSTAMRAAAASAGQPR